MALPLRPDGSFRARAFTNRKAAQNAPIEFSLEVLGLNMMMEHFPAVVQFTDNATMAITEFTGNLLANLAREIHAPHILSGDTYRSTTVADEGVQRGDGGWYIDVGPETLQARLLEWGFLHPRSKAWIQYPFMIPAADTIAPLYEDAMEQVVRVAIAEAPTLSGSPAGAGKNALDAVRDRLYSLSKLQGDLAVFGLGGPQSIRGGALRTARLIGDVQAIVRGSIGHRYTIRAAGRFSSGSLRASTSATITGPDSSYQSGARRLYNRVSGRVVSRNVLQRL